MAYLSTTNQNIIMKKILSVLSAIIAASFCLPTANAEKLDLGSRSRLRAEKCGISIEDSNGKKKIVRKKSGLKKQDYGAFITLANGYSASDLEEAGIIVRSNRGRVVLATLTSEEIEQLETLPAVESLRLERTLSRKMNLVRPLTGIDKIHTGTGLDRKYTGKGVLAGIVDGGFDPNHVNFKDENGNTRIKQFTYFRPTESGEYVTENVGSEKISEIDTESDETFHGTHTLGIMAGSYKGKATVATIVPDDTDPSGYKGENKEIENPYYGVAYDADIAIASGVSTDYHMALGIEEILNYAYDAAQEEKRRIPVVVNLSLGTNIGPHDGSSTISKYMDMASDDTQVPLIVCVAAGNEGDLPISLHKNLTANDNKVMTAFKSLDLSSTYKNAMAGQVYVYSDTDEPFELQAVIISKSRGVVTRRIPLDPSPEGAEKYLITSEDYRVSDSDMLDTQLKRYFNGYLGVAGMLDTTESNRYLAVVDLMLWDTAANLDNYVVGLIATGKDGQRLDLFTNGEFFNLSSQHLESLGFEDGSTDGTISDVATGKNIIVVGSYNVRDVWASNDGGIYTYGELFNNHEVSSFSSWGNLIDGRRLPMVCAPGATIISSSNEYYLDKYNTAGDANRQAFLEADGRKYTWHQCVGTSMSTPVVAGSIALWLEANPYLTYKDVQDIISRTAIVDDDVRKGNPVQWGAGKFNAYAGLKEALRIGSGIYDPSVTTKGECMVRKLTDNRYEIFCAGMSSIDARLYNVAGAPVFHKYATGEELVFDTTSLEPGVYVLTINRISSQKILVK